MRLPDGQKLKALLNGPFISEAELQTLNGLTSSTAELNALDGITSTVTELNLIDGLTTIVGELNLLDDAPADITLVAASAGTNVCEVTITVVDSAGVAIAECFNLDVWLSDAATGAGVTATAASGTVAVKSASGVDFEVVTAKKYTRVQTLATGIYILEITDTAKTGFYACAVIPSIGKTVIGTQLVTGDYG